jgi:hypothetical protein
MPAVKVQGPLGSAMSRRSEAPPNPRLQRTPLRAPLSRKPLDGLKRQSA